MKSKMLHSLKINVILTTLLLASTHAQAQRPVVKVIGKNSGSMSEVITLKGNTFGTNAANLAVFFGASKGNIKSVTDQLLNVEVPPGTTYDNVYVTNLTSGLTSCSRDEFMLSFGGPTGFSVSNLQGQTDFPTEKGLYDLCMSDLDGDQKIDIVTADNKSNSISILKNTSSGPGNINFTASNLLVGVHTLHVKCHDLNGDGKPDIVLSEDVGTVNTNGRIFVFQNTSTGVGIFSFASPLILTFTASKPVRIEIADLDLDGKPEVIFTDQTVNKVRILANQSSIASISLSSTPFDVTIPEAATTDGFAVQDLNGDVLPEIITSQFQTTTSNLFIGENKSTPGNFKFTLAPKLLVGGSVKRIRVGDLDGDSKADIAVTQLIGSGIAVFLNKSTGGSISFSTANSIATDVFPWGIDFGDLDGDGKADIVVASVKSTNKSITILNNTSTLGSISFTKKIVPTTYINKHVNIGDLDGDGKPDIAFTSVDDDNLGINSSKISIFRNKSCMVPQITPGGPLTICSGFPLQLQSTISNGTTYDWKQTGTPVKTGASSFLDITASGDYTVTANAEGGSCAEVSNTVTITVSASPVAALTKPSNNGPVCIGSTLNVFITNDIGATYKWTGPAGYTGTGANPASIPTVALGNAGYYFVDVIAGGCLAGRESTLVEVTDIPDFSVQFSGSNVTCVSPKALSVTPTPVNFTYQWFEKTLGALSGAIATTYNATATGVYSVKASFAGCGTTETPTVTITIATPPLPDFQMPATACMGQTIAFTDKSTTDPAAMASYLWDFGDGQNSTDQNPTHKYLSASTFNVKLTVSYNGGCSVDSPSQPISIQSAPVAVITNPDNVYTFCAGDKLKLEVLGTFNTYTWNTGETSPSILVNKAGTYTVKVTTSSCNLDADRTVVTSTPLISITGTPDQINEGKSSQLMATGLQHYLWSPAQTLSNDTIANPVATPTVTTTYTLTGKDSTGCTGTATLQLNVIGEAIVNKLAPGNFFSPNNGDSQNNFWTVGKIKDYPQCGVAIYDDKGIKVFEAKPYNEDWDGTFHGKRLPDGVYYYVIRCDGEESKPRSGSITLLR